MVEGIPKNTTLGSITYLMQVEFREENFEWAYDWANRPGEGEKYEPNAIPISTGYVPRLLILCGFRLRLMV